MGGHLSSSLPQPPKPLAMATQEHHPVHAHYSMTKASRAHLSWGPELMAAAIRMSRAESQGTKYSYSLSAAAHAKTTAAAGEDREQLTPRKNACKTIYSLTSASKKKRTKSREISAGA